MIRKGAITILLAIGVPAGTGVVSTLFAHESRLSKVETASEHIVKSLERIEKKLGTNPGL